MKRVTTFVMFQRLRWMIIIFFVCLCVITIRLVYVQLVQSESLGIKAEQLWLRDIVFQPNRGEIMDRNGQVIVSNESTSTVILIPAHIDNHDDTANKLAQVLQMPVEKAKEYVKKKASSVIIHPAGRKISAQQEEQLRQLEIPGVYLAKDNKRFYPYDSYLAHVLGFTGIDNQGLMGLELQYDQLLSGEKGAFSYYSDAKGNQLQQSGGKYQPPIDGFNLQTTIDLQVQAVIERELTIAEEMYQPDGAIAIAVNPNNGEVLGMASRPTYDPTNYQDVKQEIYNRNLPVWSTFEPGSTFKIITLAAAMEENLVDLENDSFYDKGFIHVSGARLRCWKAGGHGSQSMLEVVQNSCNPGFVHIGQLLGKEKLFSYISAFGFGEKTGIDVQGEGTGILFSLEKVGPVELGTTSFGQGVSVTPIQQVMAVSAVINGGYLYEPYLTKAWLHPETNKQVQSKEPHIKRRVISEETSKKMREALESVVAKGTGRPAYVDHYRVGGKTGTAQKVGEQGTYLANNHIVSFIGFAPADNPEIVVYVAIDNPKNTIQFGGVVAAPIVKKILEESLPLLGVERRMDGLSKETVWPEVDKIPTPNLIGENKKTLVEKMYPFEIEVYGEGNLIIDQLPKPGILLEPGSVIRLYVS